MRAQTPHDPEELVVREPYERLMDTWTISHASDCSTRNAPAWAIGPCSCGLRETVRLAVIAGCERCSDYKSAANFVANTLCDPDGASTAPHGAPAKRNGAPK